MANPEHLAILKHGVEVWNRWREDSPASIPDLANVNLRGRLNFTGINLKGAKLMDSDLRVLNLWNADLSNADLTNSDLISADLINADLRDTVLKDSNLTYADLTNAKLNRSQLWRTNFNSARLNQSDFNNANIGAASFDNVDLSQTKGLESVIHSGPSTVGLDTIYNSQGKIPEVFLRGCGVPESFIEYMRSLVNVDPIQFYSCFISYSNKNEDFATRLHNDLQAQGVRCWYAPEDMKIGDRLRPRIDEEIRIRDKLLLILTEQSIQSDWVEREVETALREERSRNKTVLFPIRLDDAVMESDTWWAAEIKDTRHIGDFRRWETSSDYQRAFDRLIRDLKADDERPTPAP